MYERCRNEDPTLDGRRVPPRLSHPEIMLRWHILKPIFKLRELCEQASKEHDHEKLMDLIKQVNWLLDQKQLESGTEDDEKRQAAPALTILFGSHRHRCLRKWLEYQPLFIALAS